MIAAGPDGNLWFTGFGTNQYVGEFNPTTHAITAYHSPSSSFPEGIAAGPDGNVWFGEYGANQLGMINPTTDVITEFADPNGQPSRDRSRPRWKRLVR